MPHQIVHFGSLVNKIFLYDDVAMQVRERNIGEKLINETYNFTDNKIRAISSHPLLRIRITDLSRRKPLSPTDIPRILPKGLGWNAPRVPRIVSVLWQD